MQAAQVPFPAFDTPPRPWNCRICGSGAEPRFLAIVDGCAVVKCAHCRGETFQGIPTPTTLSHAYDGFDAGAIARANLTEYVRLARDILAQEMKHLGALGPGRLQFFDYGCGGGHFVQAASDLGIDSSGMELDPQSVDAAVRRGLRVIQGRLPDDGSLVASASYDYIKCMHVLEHTAAPLDVLKEFRRLVRPGGIVVVSVPDQSSFPSRLKIALRIIGLKKREFGFIQPPIHLHGFTRDAIRVSAEEAGFRVVEVRRTSPLDTRTFPTVPAYWSGIAIQKLTYRIGRLLMSPGHLTAILTPA